MELRGKMPSNLPVLTRQAILFVVLFGHSHN
jgi:hypothetical protein